MPSKRSTASPLSLSEVARLAVRDHGAMQKPRELTELLDELAARARFNLGRLGNVLEIGGMYGGTAWAWHQLGAERVVVVDKFVLDGRMERADAPHILIEGDSHDPASRARVEPFAPFDLLFIDGDHSYEGVRKDFLMYAPLVAARGIIALHDVSVEQPPWVRDQHDVVPWWNQVRKHYTHTEIFDKRGEQWGGIGLLVAPPDNAELVASLADLPSPTDEERVATVPCDTPCNHCGKQLVPGEEIYCAECARQATERARAAS